MRNQPRSWMALFNKLGIRRKKHRFNSIKRQQRKLRFEQFEDRRMLAAFTVNVAYDTASTDNDDTVITLREAVNRANATPAPDIINFDSLLDGATITLGIDSSDTVISSLMGPAGALTITDSVTIVGKDSNGILLNITIDASATDPTPDSEITDLDLPPFEDEVDRVNDGDGSSVFNIVLNAGTTVEKVTIDSLTITGGDAGFGGGISFLGNTLTSPGNAQLTVRDSTITGNYSLAV